VIGHPPACNFYWFFVQKCVFSSRWRLRFPAFSHNLYNPCHSIRRPQVTPPSTGCWYQAVFSRFCRDTTFCLLRRFFFFPFFFAPFINFAVKGCPPPWRSSTLVPHSLGPYFPLPFCFVHPPRFLLCPLLPVESPQRSFSLHFFKFFVFFFEDFLSIFSSTIALPKCFEFPPLGVWSPFTLEWYPLFSARFLFFPPLYLTLFRIFTSSFPFPAQYCCNELPRHPITHLIFPFPPLAFFFSCGLVLPPVLDSFEAPTRALFFKSSPLRVPD